MKNIIFSLMFGFAFCTLVSFTAFAQESLAQQTQVEAQPFTEAELAQMLAPIALYPDSLLTHILIASTYPIEIVEAHRWLLKNDKLNSKQLAKSVEDFDWDVSVKALVPFERILSRLSEDLSWTQQLGDAFLQDEERLLDSIQVLRQQASLAGNLDKMENMDVSYENSNIVIEPRKKEIVYVPYYDTRMVYGAWHWSSYPPVYWTPHHSVYVNHHRPFYWHSGIHISFDYFFSAFHWHNRHVVVVNSASSHRRYYNQRPRRLIAEGGYAKRWAHQPKHRKGVAYRSKHTSQKYHSNRVNVHTVNKKRHNTHFNGSRLTKVQTKHKETSRPVSMSHATKATVLKPKQELRFNTRLKEETPKRMPQKAKEEKASKHNSRNDSAKHESAPVRKQQHNKSRKLNHHNRSMKKHQ